MYSPLIAYGAFWSALNILKKLLCPLPVKACLTRGCSEAPNFCEPNKAIPNIAGSGIESKTTSAGCGLSKLS